MCIRDRISLVAVFIPLAFQTSTTGRLFVEFAVAVAGSVIISAFVALTLTPMMASRILKETHQTRHNFVVRGFERLLNAFNNGYRRLLQWSLVHRFVIVIAAVVSFALMIVTYRHLEQEFLPDEDRGLLLCILAAPEGATTEYTLRMMQEVEGILRATPEVRLFGGIVAPAFSGPGQPNNAIFFVHFNHDRKRSVQEIVNAPDGLRNKLFAQIEGALAFPSLPKAFSRGINAPFNLVIQAQDLGELDKYTTELVNKLRGQAWLQNVRPSFEVNKPELRLDIDRDRASALGVSIEDISRTMQIMFGGLDLSRIKIGGKEYEVIAQLGRESRLTPQSLDQLYVRNASNSLVQLSSVVSYRSGSAPNTIEHYNRLRSATISATPIGVPLGTAVQRVEEMLRTDLPQGFLYDWAGESRDLRDAGREVWFVLILAIIIVYMVLAAQFESLVHPLTVILAIPLAAVGAFGLLWLVNHLGKAGIIPVVPAMNINLFSQIGLVLLIGLVTKNSILLVEFANQRRAEGVNPHDAMLQAGTVRLRPILMTAFSTIAGILPIAIGFGAGAESRRPMGVAVVGGMLTSTFLTLIVIPVVYTLFTDFASFFKRKRPEAPAASDAVTVGK